MFTDSADIAMLAGNQSFTGTCIVVSRKRNQRSIESSHKFHGYSLKQLYGFLLIFSLVLPSSMSIPLNKRSSTDPKSTGDNPHWVNPCPGVPSSSSSAVKRSVSEEDQGTETDFINSIVLTSKHAIYQAETFRERYVLRTFSIEFEKHHINWKSAKYGWLAQEVFLPKELGEKIPKEKLEKMELDDESIKIYGYLQRLAVAFEQVIQDQRSVNSEFTKEFVEAETHLKSILCELKEIIPEAKFADYQNANADTMPTEFRHMDDHTYRHVRDWLIFRDYMNVVEYLIEVMEYFKTKTV